MSIWVVGDVQGCRKPLKRLLQRVDFRWDRDQLWSTGDIVNRGPQCLKTLRFFYRHRDNIRLVLGNHDLHLLAIASGARKLGRSDTLAPILYAKDSDLLLSWLQTQPLIYQEHDATLVHAGIPPQWSLEDAALRAREVEAVLGSEKAPKFFKAMYGNEPSGWSDELEGLARLRVITNYFTRMRYCHPDGQLDLLSKGPLNDPGGPAAGSTTLDAWFRHPRPKHGDARILFGHWASLQGVTGIESAIALDTGCVWGNAMTLYCLETQERVTEPCECRS
ncbi:MAG: symmetrical bis(5'-nucleosyl)-tetraphosphatase [Congregibacter sp.]